MSPWIRILGGVVVACLAAAAFVVALTPTKKEKSDGPILEIASRATWSAAAANESLMRRHTPRAIIIHHTDTAQNPVRTLESKLKGLQEYSMSPGTVSETGKEKPAWGDVPYHYYIDVTGRIGEGRDITFAGDTNTGYGTDGFVQIVVEGKFETEMPEPRQLAALDELVISLAQSLSISSKDVTGHNDHAISDCPGRNLKAHLGALRRKVDARAR
jgi:hypothetical protein